MSSGPHQINTARDDHGEDHAGERDHIPADTRQDGFTHLFGSQLAFDLPDSLGRFFHCSRIARALALLADQFLFELLDLMIQGAEPYGAESLNPAMPAETQKGVRHNIHTPR